MCQADSRLVYSPRRLVWSASDTGRADCEGAASDGDSETDGGGDGGARPEPPAPKRRLVSDAALRNWRQPMPLSRKIRLAVKNIGIKIRTGQTCCGNFGEPGC